MAFICELCGKEFSSSEGFRNHRTSKHPEQYPKEIHNAICPICGEHTTSYISFRRHLEKHGISRTDINFFIYTEEAFNNHFKYDGVTIPIEISKDLLNHLFQFNKCEKLYHRQAVSFYKMIICIREYEIGSDTINFIENVLPWKLKHPGAGNSKELCNIIFKNEPENASKLYEQYMLSKNPFVGHGSELSPFSKDFNGYKNLTEDEKIKKVRDALRVDMEGRNTCQIEYWTKRGLTELEAIEMVHRRQQTFSFEKCVKKYGFEEGKKRWEERQTKWQNTLKSKPYEEQMRILTAKVTNSKITKAYSRIEHEFSHRLVSEEFMNVPVTLYAVPDICVGNKIIEFYGDYYHCNPSKYKPDYYNHDAKKTAQEVWDKDAERIQRLINDGFEVKIVWESEYKKDKEAVIADCKKFLEEI